jgi:hypothetical protein
VKHFRIEWGSSEVWNGNVKGAVPEDTSAGMGRGRGRNGRSDELGENPDERSVSQEVVREKGDIIIMQGMRHNGN